MPSSKRQGRSRTVELITEARLEFAERRLEGRSAAKLAAALRYIAGLESRIRHLEEYRKPPAKLPKIGRTLKSDRSESVPVLVLSDLHMEEIVDPRRVNGINEYNPEIARTSLRQVFESNIKLVRMFARDTVIRSQVIPILGDLITNASMPHPGMMRTCAMGPSEAANFAYTCLRDGIDLTLNATKLRLHLPCVGGNHDRSTEEVIIGEEAGFSWATQVYRRLAEAYAGEPRITVEVAEDHLLYGTVFDRVIRYHHGHSVRGSSNSSGGLLAMLRGAAMAWDVNRRADITVSGHFHTRINTGGIVSNSSLIGPTAYSVFNKFGKEPAQQELFLIEKRNGGTMSISCPVWAR